MLCLYSTPLSANGRKVLAVARHLGLDAEIETVNVYAGEGRDPDYLRVNPFGKIPTLVDGEFVLWESNAICVYLCEAGGDSDLSSSDLSSSDLSSSGLSSSDLSSSGLSSSGLWSNDVRVRADILRWLFWESCQWQPALVAILTEHVARLVVPSLADSPPVAVDWANPNLQSLLDFLERHLTATGRLVGSEWTLADLSVAAMCMYAPSASFPFASFPAIQRWYEGIEQLEAWQSTTAGPWTTERES